MLKALLSAVLLAATLATPARAEGARYLDLVFDASEVVQVENIQYGRAVNWEGQWKDLLLDVHYVPTDGATWRPAVVWVHGGYFLNGSKDSYQDVIDEIVRSGYVVVSINYRLQGGDFPYGLTPELITEGREDQYLDAIREAQHDAQAAIRWTRLNAASFDIDPDRVAIMGHSAGGLTATAVAFNSDTDPGNSGSFGPSSVPNTAVAITAAGLIGRQLKINNGDVPIQMVHGLADTVVPWAASTPQICAATIAVGNSCEQVLDPDRGHSTFAYPEIREYLYRWLVDRPNLRLPTKLTVVP